MPNYMDEMIEQIKKKKKLAEQEMALPQKPEPPEEKTPEIFHAEKKPEKEQKLFKKQAEEPKPAKPTLAYRQSFSKYPSQPKLQPKKFPTLQRELSPTASSLCASL